MPTFSAFFDESGTQRSSSTVVVGGYVGSANQWEAFRREWQALLNQERIRVLHRSHLETFRGEFQRKNGWNDERRKCVLQCAHEIIKQRTDVGIAAAVIRGDFERVMPPALKRAFGGPYGWAAHDCVVGIGHWAATHQRPQLVQYVFEAGARGRKQVEKMFESLYSDPKFRELCRNWKLDFRTESRLPRTSASRLLCLRNLQTHGQSDRVGCHDSTAPISQGPRATQ